MKVAAEQGKDTFRAYTALILTDEMYQPNLAYQSSTADIWSRANTEWEKMHN